MDLFWSIIGKEHKELKAVLQGNAEFAKNLYAILAKEPGNVFFSPLSIHAILSLLYQGARGHTQEAFTKALNVPDIKVAALGYKEIMSSLNAINKVTLLMANKVFLHEDYKLQEGFNTVAVKKFSSKVKVLNFKQSEVAASSINSWVKKKTSNKIKDVINSDELSNDVALVLVNAIYFKGKWAYGFDVQNTRIQKFFLNDVDTIDVQMMYMHIRDKKLFFYKEDANLKAQVLELPYINKNITMVIVLPYERNGIVELEQKLANTDITKLTENMRKSEVVITLPKFKIEQTIDLNGPLTELGLGVIFSKDAEFSGIIKTTNNIFVSKAIQKVFIEVNEEGTEAAAAPELVMRELCRREVDFNANHPFFVILCSRQHGTVNVLFGGRVSKPQY